MNPLQKIYQSFSKSALVLLFLVHQQTMAMPNNVYQVDFIDVKLPSGEYVKDIIIKASTYSTTQSLTHYHSVLGHPIENPLRYDFDDNDCFLTANFIKLKNRPVFADNVLSYTAEGQIIQTENAIILMDDTYPEFWFATHYTKQPMAGKKVYDYVFTGTTDNAALIEQMNQLPDEIISFDQDDFCWQPTSSYASIDYLSYAHNKEKSIAGLTFEKWNIIAQLEPDAQAEIEQNIVDRGTWQGRHWFTFEDKPNDTNKMQKSAMIFDDAGLHQGIYIQQGLQTFESYGYPCYLSKPQASKIANALLMLLNHEKN